MRKVISTLSFNYQTSRYNAINLSAPSTFYVYHPIIQAKDLSIQKIFKLKDLPMFDAKSLGFGLNSTDHMVAMDYDKVKGWGKP